MLIPYCAGDDHVLRGRESTGSTKKLLTSIVQMNEIDLVSNETATADKRWLISRVYDSLRLGRVAIR